LPHTVGLSASRKSRGQASRGRRGRRSRDLDVVFEDDSIVVVNKPPGVLSVPLERHPTATSVFVQLTSRYRSHGKQRPFVVHRIDQDSSGLVVFARSAVAQRALVEQFKRREPERVYLAIVYGKLEPPSGIWRDRLVWNPKALIQRVARPGDSDVEEAISDYRVVEELRNASLLEIRLRTGRRNQIRIQAAICGHPLVGERRYLSDRPPPAVIHFERQALHALRLTFRHPRDGRVMKVEAPPPPDFVDLLTRLRK
jgi:23S rRNA pseudouridine1911/1915/1917 synthase